MAQFLRPVSDTAAGPWLPSVAGAGLYSLLDESSPVDTDFIYAIAPGVVKIKLASGTDPSLSTGHIIRYRAQGNGLNDMRVYLVDTSGPGVVGTWVEPAAAATMTDYSHTLTGAEADAISDYTALEMWLSLVATVPLTTVLGTGAVGTLTPSTGGSGVAPTPGNHKFAGNGTGNQSVSVTPDTDVTSGRLGVIKMSIYNGDSGWDGTVSAGQLTKTGGTATIGTVTLDVTTQRADATAQVIAVIYSFPITGNGTLTMTWAEGAGSGTNLYKSITFTEVQDADTSGTRVAATNSNNSDTDVTSTSAGSVATGGAGIIFGMLNPGNPYGTQNFDPVAGFTQLSEQTDDSTSNYNDCYRTDATATTDDPAWENGPSSKPVSVAVAYKSSTP